MDKRILLSTATIHGDEMEFVREAFDTNWVAPLGKNVDLFEEELAASVGSTAGAACVSGTSALFLAYRLAGVKPGDQVLCSDFTFSATANPIVYLGGEPVFVDSERDTWNMSPEALEEAFRKHPQAKVVVLVHLYGVPAKMDELLEICRRHGAVLVEDAAEALGATYKGKNCGSFGTYSAISFNGNKIITTSGGGMLLSQDRESIKTAKKWSTQSREDVPWYEHRELGFNFRMSNVVAGIGRGQLLHLQEHLDRKREIYRGYQERLKDLPLTMNPYLPETGPNFWLSAVLFRKDVGVDITELVRKLNDRKIEARHIWKPMHMQPFYQDCDFISTGVGEDVFSRGLCLPSDIKMTESQQDYVAETLARLL